MSNLDKDRCKEMVDLISPMHVASYYIHPIVVSKDDPNRGTIMSMSQFYFVGNDNIVAYVNSYINQLINVDEEPNNDKENEMIATEVIE